jgi:hypothetical protein
MDRLQSLRLFAKPRLSLLMLACRTVTITARSTDPVIAIAVLAVIDHVAQFSGAAACNDAEYFSDVQRSGLLSGLEKRRRVLPDALGNSGHCRCDLQLPPEQTFDDLASIGLGAFSEMQVDHGRLQARVTEVLLNHTQTDSGFQQVRGVAVAKSVGGHFLAEVHLLGDLLHGSLHGRGTHGSGGF